MKFFKFYFKKIFKTWWTLISAVLFGLPALQGPIEGWFGTQGSEQVNSVIELLRPWLPWIALVMFWFVHIRAIYNLFSENQKGLKTGMSDEYETVTLKVENAFSTIGLKFRKEMQNAYSCLSNRNLDIKTTVTIHFGAYRLVKDSIVELFKHPPQGLQMSKEIGEVLSKFNDNINSLENHFNTNAKNNTLQIDEFGVRALVSNINQNIIALLSLL